MPRAKHTGLTTRGHLKYLKVERVRSVTIYKRGDSYQVYYRENGKTVRMPVEGNLATARATASKIASSLDEGRPSPFGFQRITLEELQTGFLGYTKDVQGLALRSRDRYRAALDRFKAFAEERKILSADAVTLASVEDFVRWLRNQHRSRNGHHAAAKAAYKTGGIKFILSTCRTAFNWAARRRHLPPYAENPFSTFNIDKLRDRDEASQQKPLLTPDEQEAFFEKCDEWQRPLFTMLAVYGLRVGELTHLLIEDVDFRKGSIHIRSKPLMHWHVKTDLERVLPTIPAMEELLRRVIGTRSAGFVFLNSNFSHKDLSTSPALASTEAFNVYLRRVAASADLNVPEPEKEVVRLITQACRELGQIPEKRIRQEFIKLTKQVGRPDLTRAHDLRHVFASRTQEMGMNSILAQELLGHTTQKMTKRYTHLGLQVKRDALQLATAPYLLSKKEEEK